MRPGITAVGLVLAFMGLTLAQDKEADEAQDTTVVVVQKPGAEFTVAENELVRLTGKGIAGAKITAKVEGPAEVHAAARLATVDAKEGKRLYGSGDKEFTIKPTGKGKVTVTIETKNPTSDKPTKVVYKFNVE